MYYVLYIIIYIIITKNKTIKTAKQQNKKIKKTKTIII